MLMDPYWTLRTGSVPFWSVFPVESSVRAAHDHLDSADPYRNIRLGLFCHGVESAGMATAAQWQGVLDRATRSGSFAGVSPRLYPADPRAFFDFGRALRAIPERHPLPPEPLPLAGLLTDERPRLLSC